MATYNLRRFAHADGLKAIAREHLLGVVPNLVAVSMTRRFPGT
jgi:hypothetical protein